MSKEQRAERKRTGRRRQQQKAKAHAHTFLRLKSAVTAKKSFGYLRIMESKRVNGAMAPKSGAGFRLLEGDTTRTTAQVEAMAAAVIRAYPARKEVALLQYSKARGFQTHPAHGAADDPSQSSRRNTRGGDQETSRENAHDPQQIRSETGSVTPGEHSGPRAHTPRKRISNDSAVTIKVALPTADWVWLRNTESLIGCWVDARRLSKSCKHCKGMVLLQEDRGKG